MNKERYAANIAGNWQNMGISWWGRPEEVDLDPDDWALVYFDNRDSTTLEQANAQVIRQEMEPYLDDEKWGVCLFEQTHNHWACGWVAGYAIRVYQPGTERGGCTPTRDEERELTPVFLKWCELQEAMENYPLLCEELYSEMEHEATLKNIEQEGKRLLRDDAPEDWPSQCFSWFWDNNQRAVENRDDQGGYPSEEEMRECLLALHLLDEYHMSEEEIEAERKWRDSLDAPGQMLIPFTQES